MAKATPIRHSVKKKPTTTTPKKVVEPTPTQAQRFVIRGKNALIRAMWTELQPLGYHLTASGINDKATGIVVNLPMRTERTKYDFQELWASNKIGIYDLGKEFKLPAQYDEALAFAAEQLSDKFWKKELEKYKVGDYVVMISNDEGGPYKKGMWGKVVRLWGGGEPDTYDINNGKLGPSGLSSKVFRRATPEEILKFTPKFKELLGIGSSNLRVLVYEDRVDVFGRYSLTIKIKDLIDYRNSFPKTVRIEGYTMGIHKTDWRFILVGCEGEDNRISLDDLDRIINAKNSLG